LAGDVRAYLSDQPLLSWLAFQYLNTGNLYVSETIRANPLTLAYQSGSVLRPLADAAVIRTFTDTAWASARQRLESAWFPHQGSANSGDTASQVNVPTLVAACVLVFAWLAAILAATVRKALRAAGGGDPLTRVSTVLHGRLMRLVHEARGAGGEGDDTAAASATAAAQREEAGRMKTDEMT
jgi:hypothetical protein